MSLRAISVYVAGATAELDEVVHQMRRLRAEGLIVTHDWAAQRIEDGRPDAALSLPEREAIAAQCLKGVRDAHIVWIMAPSPKTRTAGLFVELGYAVGQCRPMIVSRDDGRSVFSSLARRSFATHDEAAEYLIEAQRRQLAYERLDWTVAT